MSNNKNKKQNKEIYLNQETLENVPNKKIYKSQEIDPLEKNTGQEELEDEDKIFNNIHIKPADEQQFEKNSLDPDNIKQ